MMKITLRAEYKENERRTPLTPHDAAELIQKGYEVLVESSDTRIFKDSEYSDAGCSLIAKHSWQNNLNNEGSQNNIILGLKELPLDLLEIAGKHIYFAHIFKGQANSEHVFKQYKKGKGELLDLEFLQNSAGRRVAAFGYWAGYVGAALALKQYALNLKSLELKELSPFNSQEDFLSWLSEDCDKKSLSKVKAIIIGAKGRCGSGAQELFNNFGVNISGWDFEQTKKGGPFKEIIEHQIFVNCVYLSTKIPPFITSEILNQSQNQLEVICDVSCDPNNALNPIPVYNDYTTWECPVSPIKSSKTKIIAIDNLPTLLPKESSIDFSNQLLPILLDLKEDKLQTWQRALDFFYSNKKEY